MNRQHEGDIPVAHPDHFFIGGRWLSPASDAVFQVIDPTTEQTAYEAPAANSVDVDRAIAAAREAFDNGPWPRMSPSERATYLRAIATELRRRTPDLAQLWTRETGAVHSQALGALATPPEIYEFYADLADTFPFIEHCPERRR